VEIRRRYGSESRLAEALRRSASFVPAREALDLLREAVELATATQLRPVLARALTAYGLALQRCDHHEAAREVLYRATDLGAGMGMERLVARAHQGLLQAGARPRRTRATGPTSLTDSQAQVAALAAEGLSNREIAERLYVTIKTVETHLMAVFRKLGITGRDQIPEALALEPA